MYKSIIICRLVKLVCYILVHWKPKTNQTRIHTFDNHLFRKIMFSALWRLGICIFNTATGDLLCCRWLFPYWLQMNAYLPTLCPRISGLPSIDCNEHIIHHHSHQAAWNMHTNYLNESDIVIYSWKWHMTIGKKLLTKSVVHTVLHGLLLSHRYWLE